MSPPDNGPVLDDDMSGKIGRICHHDPRPQMAIVRHMAIGHQKILVANARQHPASLGSPVNGDGLPDGVSVSDHNAARFSPVFQVLGRKSGGRKRIEEIVFSDRRVSIDDHMGQEAGSGADRDLSFQDTERSDINAWPQFNLRRHFGRGMYKNLPLPGLSRQTRLRPAHAFSSGDTSFFVCFGGAGRIMAMISASQIRFSPTRISPSIFQELPRTFRVVKVMTSVSPGPAG